MTHINFNFLTNYKEQKEKRKPTLIKLASEEYLPTYPPSFLFAFSNPPPPVQAFPYRVKTRN